MKILFIEVDKQYLLGLPAGFQKQGCQVRILSNIEEKELNRILEEYEPDLVVTVGWTKIHTRKNLEVLGRLMKKHGVKHAYWATEDPGWMDRWTLPYIESTHPDLIFTIDRVVLPYYRERGYKAHYLPWACNPDFHQPAAEKDEYRCDIALVATGGNDWSDCRKKSVQILLKPLVENNYNVLIWGKGWDKLKPGVLGFDVKTRYLRGKLSYLETNHVYNSAKIVLGVQNTTTELTARTYEVLGARGFLLAPATTAVIKTFKPGRNLAVSRSEEETLRMVDYYLSHEDERVKIALKGQKEVYANHTYSHRAAEILKVVIK